VQTVLCVPIRRESAVIGVLMLAARRANAFDEDAQALVARLADRAAIAIENGRLYDAVQAANRAKSEFVSLVAHELKVPMTSIRGYADLLAVAGDINEQQQSFVHTIKNNVERMAVLVSDLSDISRIESGQLNVKREPVNVLAALSEAKDGVLQQVKLREHTLLEEVNDALPLVWGDRSRVVQVLVNLLSNAYKYTPDGGTIVVRADTDGDAVHISVSDTGIGMTSDQIANLGTKFWRADDEHVTQQPGTGLGMAITFNLVTLMDGELTVDSTPGEGSTFSVIFDVCQESE
jgi:signal transduction histidine kinase